MRCTLAIVIALGMTAYAFRDRIEYCAETLAYGPACFYPIE